jgi:superfamily II DNA/RNA helicase
MKVFNVPEIPQILQDNLYRIGFKKPTNIQKKSIPYIIKGDDVLASGQTGTGKTAAYGIPLAINLLSNKSNYVLILLPTRELASQVAEDIQRFIGKEQRINSALLIGGSDIKRQIRYLKTRPQLIIGTPGRINDHIKRETLNLRKFSFVVLDEVDRMLDMGFINQLEEILTSINHIRQTLMFSATISKQVKKNFSKLLKKSKTYINREARQTSYETQRVLH